MKLKKGAILLIILCISATILGGCKNQPESSPSNSPAVPPSAPIESGKVPDTDISGGKNNDSDNTGNSIDADQLYTDMSLSGTVAEFTSDGCTVIPIINEEAGGGSLAYQPVPGTEDKGKNVTVSYNDDCVFQIAVINVETGTAVLSDALKEDIKKQTTLMLYGDYQDTYHLNVSKVIIQRLEGVSK